MAIQVDLSTSQFGVPFSAAYFRIVAAVVSRQRGGVQSVMIDIAGYASKPESDDTKEVDFRRYHAPYSDIEAMPGDNFLAKCYSYLMTQTDMAGCTAI